MTDECPCMCKGSGCMCKGSGCMSVENLNPPAPQISIFPNPANTSLTLQLPPSSKNIELEITNAIGQKILSQKENTFSATIDISGYAKGVYFIRLKEGDNWEVRKFVKL